jgi:hypothetical protein
MESRLGYTTNEAIQILTKSGKMPDMPEDAVDVYSTSYRQRRQKVQSLWDDASKKFPGDGCPLNNLRKFFFPSKTERDNWGVVGRGVLGETSVAKILELFPNYKTKTRVRHKDTTMVAIQPLYSLPGKISAFRVAASDSDKWQVLDVYPDVNDAKLLFLDRSIKINNSTLLVVTSLHEATELAMRCLHEGCEMWPTVATETPVDREHLFKIFKTNDMLVVGRKSILFDFKLAAILQARLCDLSDRSNKPVHDAARLKGYHNWARKTYGEAKRPEKVVFDFFAAKRFTELTSILESIPDRVSLVAAAVSYAESIGSPAASQLREFAKSTSSVFVADGQKILTRSDCWVTASEELVFDATVSLDTIFHRASTKQTWYRGEIGIDSTKLTFVVERDKFERDPFMFVRNHCIESGQRAPVPRRKWNAKALELILSGSQPKTVLVPDKAGWDHASKEFLFSGLRLGVGGEIRLLELPQSLFEQSGGFGLPLPNHYRNDELASRFISQGYDLFVFVVSRLLAPVFDDRQQGLLIYGACVKQALSFVQAMGCALLDETAVTKNAGSWPSLVQHSGQRSKAAMHLPSNAIVQTDATGAVQHGLGKHWLTLEIPSLPFADPELCRCVGSLISDFLVFAVRHTSFLTLQNQPYIDRTDAMVREFFSLRGIECPVLSLRHSYRNQLESLQDFLSLFFRRQRRRSSRKNADHIISGDLCWIGRREVRKYLKFSAAEYNVDRITDISRDFSLCPEGPKPAFEEGWFFSTKWISPILRHEPFKIADATTAHP